LLSVLGVSSFVPPAEVPPADSPSPVAPALLLLPPVDSELDSLSGELDSLSLPVFVFAVALVEVAVVRAASFSALVFVGGVISGVVFGVASETLPEPPHAPRPTPHASASTVAAAAVAALRARGRRARLGVLCALTRSL
jgi:hypothetical protein